MNLFYVLFLAFPLMAQSKSIELEITSRWFTKKTKEELSTLVFVKPGESLKLPLEARKAAFLNLKAQQEGNEVILSTQLIEKINGKEVVSMNKTIRAKLGKKAQITSTSHDGKERLELEIIPGN